MKKFMDDDFLLQNETAKRLYHDYAKDMPIIDYHCHLNPKEIAENRLYGNITEAWLGGDHYKWRAMRANGVGEQYVTGSADDRSKFMKWAETMPACIGNPLYHWTHLELRRYFGINELLSPETAEDIWNRCNEKLRTHDFTPRSLIQRSNVKALCTTDDPVDSLEYHEAIARDKTFNVKVLPSFRPDNAINIEKPSFNEWIGRLVQAAGMEIRTLDDLKSALVKRLEFFHSKGCRLSDHGLEPAVFMDCTEAEAAAVFEKAVCEGEISPDEVKKYKTHMLIFLGTQYSRLGWVMQLHIGCIRNTNSKQFRLLGPNTGFDAIDDENFAGALSSLLDRINDAGGLPKTILYCLNPRDNEVLSAIAGSFQDGTAPGKIQFGSGWWFNDQKDGMQKQMTTLAAMGLLSRFVGMLTDSRSFLSYTRHEYFRRILCNMIGELAEKGEAPDDIKLLGGMVQDICYNNAVKYFGFMERTEG
ncbi:MAG TPA: glucuronate isomerase [Clostridia bacterium]|nr:glucuronate isomerase [Clostridia bacterium]